VTAVPLLEAVDLRVERGGVPVLDVPSFRLEEGEFVSLIGPNGCGKSTLLLSLMGLLPRAGGQVRWRGAEPSSGREAVALREELRSKRRRGERDSFVSRVLAQPTLPLMGDVPEPAHAR